MDSVHELVSRYRTEADTMKRYGDQRGAAMLARIVDDLEEVLHSGEHQYVNLSQASALCGYSTDQLRRLIRCGTLKDHGRKNAPRVRVSDLPKKCQDLRRDVPSMHVPSAVETARSIVNRQAA